MYVDIPTEFLMLLQGDAPTGTALATREVGHTRTGSVLIAVDNGGLRHVLVPIDARVREDRRSKVLSLTVRTLEASDGTRTFMDVECTDVRLSTLFERVAGDIIHRLGEGADPNAVCGIALSDWRDLFQAAQAGTTAEDAVGLIGELELLRLIADQASPPDALRTWWGPSRHVHDFYSDVNQAIEVKTTTALDGDRVQISSLDQLDHEPLAMLHLAVVQLRPDTSAPTLDERINLLLKSGLDRRDLLDKVADSGHLLGGPCAIDTRFTVRKLRVWKVDSDFPGLRRSALSEELLAGLGNVKYELRLEAAREPLPQGDIDELLANWGSDD